MDLTNKGFTDSGKKEVIGLTNSGLDKPKEHSLNRINRQWEDDNDPVIMPEEEDVVKWKTQKMDEGQWEDCISEHDELFLMDVAIWSSVSAEGKKQVRLYVIPDNELPPIQEARNLFRWIGCAL